jgi:hypothetical protein
MTAATLDSVYPEAAGLRIKTLRLGLVLNALIDVVGAIAFRWAPDTVTQWLGVKPPQDEFWARYAAVFLVVVPMFYLIAALNPLRYLGNVVGAIVARLLGFGFYFGYYLRVAEARKPFLSLAFMNLAFAVVFAWLISSVGWWRALASLRPLRRAQTP